MIKVLVAEEHPAILNCISCLLMEQPDFKLVGTAIDGREAVEKAVELLPDVVVIDDRMPSMGGAEATRHLKQSLPGVGVLFLSLYSDGSEDSVAAGADGILAKDCQPKELFLQVRRIAANMARANRPPTLRA